MLNPQGRRVNNLLRSSNQSQNRPVFIVHLAIKVSVNDATQLEAFAIEYVVVE
jgi:hypothetical protein